MTNTNTPLHIAARDGNVEIVKMLLNAGADPNAKNADGQTPLHLATQAGHIEVVSLLASKTRTSTPPNVSPSGTTTQGNPSEVPNTLGDKAFAWGCGIIVAFFVIWLIYNTCVSIHTGEAAETAGRTLGNGEWWLKLAGRAFLAIVIVPFLAALWAALTGKFSNKK